MNKTYNVTNEIKFIPGKKQIEIILLLINDLVCFAFVTAIVSILRFILFTGEKGNIFDPQFIKTIGTLTIFSIAILAVRDLYPGWGRSSVAELKQVVEAETIAYFITFILVLVQGSPIFFSESIFLITWFFIIIVLPVGRFLVRKFISKSNWWGEPVIIIGSEKQIRDIYTRLIGCQRLGIRPVAGLTVDTTECDRIGKFIIYPWSINIQKSFQNAGIKTNVLAISANQLSREYPYIFKNIELSFKNTIFILDKNVYSVMMAQPIDLAGQPAIISRHSLLDTPTLFAKQAVELIMSLIVLLPIILIGIILAILIKVDSPGPIFFTQERIGRNGKKIKIFKFRTMYQNADQALDKILLDPIQRHEWDTYHKLSNDPRITYIGNFIRKYSLDELPQFINVLRGEMTLIGPRPLIKAEIDELGETANTILHIRPGITGWWQVMGRNNLSFEERTTLDLYYVYNWSLWLDMFIFIKTFWVITFNN